MLIPEAEIQDHIPFNESKPLNDELMYNTNLQCIIDEKRCFRCLSSSAYYFLDYQESELIGKKASSLINADDQDAFTSAMHQLSSGQTMTLSNIRLHCKNGTIKPAEVSMTNFLGYAPVQGILINYRDLSNYGQETHFKEEVIESHAAFFAKHPFGIFHMTRDRAVDRINPQLIADLGYTLKDIRQKPIMSFLPPKYRRKVSLMFYLAIHNMEAETYDVEVYKKSGETLHVNFTIVPVVYKNNVIEVYGVVKDITDRIELQESLRRTSIVADRSLNGVLIMDRKRKIEWVNKGFSLMSGFSLAECLGKDPGRLLRVEGVSEQLTDELSKLLEAGKSLKKEMLCLKKDNTPYWNLVEVTPVLDKNGKLERVISMHTDISEKKKAEDELKRFADDLYRQNKELQQFAYIVSHNLRSPVANIVGLTTLLSYYKDDPETLNEALADLVKSANNLDTVIKDLSNILEISNGSKELTREQINISNLLGQVLVDLQAVIANAAATIDISDIPCAIQSNKAYLYSIFYNLISNSVKYKSELAPKIKINCHCEPGRTTFTLSDNGVGIDLARHSESIFKPYKRFNSTTEGKGLGLFLVKCHVEALGGKIEVNSQPGQGTTFVFSLPA